MSDADDDAKPEPETTRNKLVVGVVAIAIGMGCVALAFRVRWMDDSDLIHPFPLFLTIGSLIIFAATKGCVTAIVRLHRLRKQRDQQ
jgi:hypothetical protein